MDSEFEDGIILYSGNRIQAGRDPFAIEPDCKDQVTLQGNEMSVVKAEEKP